MLAALRWWDRARKGEQEKRLIGFTEARSALKNTIFESRVDSAFFDQRILSGFDAQRVELSASVPFERFTAPRQLDG
jgi:hypothetical protein